MYALASLLAVVAVSLLVGRIATVILVATGLSREAARFQARSALTGTGFTTSEAERVVDHPVRRRVVLFLMLVGNAGLVASASTLILGFNGGGGGQAWRVLELVAGLIAIVFVSRSAWMDRRLTSLIARLLARFTDLPDRDVGGLLRLARHYAVNELQVQDGDWLAGRTLADLALRDEGVVLLGIVRADGDYLGAPLGRTLVCAGDTLVLYGRSRALCELDERPAGAAGDAAHEAAAARHRDARRQEARADEVDALRR